MRTLIPIILLLTPTILLSQVQKPAIVILGVSHSEQLINYSQQPAALRSFIKRVKPGAICIECSPKQFARNDFYEFTYEQQYCVVPFARKNNIPLHPIDWQPREDDLLLAFGISDLEVPPFSRNPSGFWGFTVFSDSSSLWKSLYYADDSSTNIEDEKWYAVYPEQVNLDFARRLFLYRTFLQAKRIEEYTKYYRADTLLVIIGSMHKVDIERHLRLDGFTVIQPSAFGELTEQEIAANYEDLDAYSICSFNLLGVQSTTQLVNQRLVEQAITHLLPMNSSESILFQIRHDLLQGTITAEQAIERYRILLNREDVSHPFTWTGVKHNNRVDSYFDPFGNLTLWQRLHLELAREYRNVNNMTKYDLEKHILTSAVGSSQQAMFLKYLTEYIEK